jgi:hypothetical protein
VDSQGALLGIITKRTARGLGGASAEVGLAVPTETVIGLADGSGNQALGCGAALQMPAKRPSPSTAAVVASSAQRHPPHRANASHGVPRYALHARFIGEGVGGPERL